jgi:hypothetical protein
VTVAGKARPKATHSTKDSTKKPRGNPQNLKPWKPGQSGNPGGRKKGDSNSITSYLKEFAGMTPQAVAEECDTFAKELRRHPDKLPMAGIVAVRALMALIDEPDARLFGHVLDRIDGVQTTKNDALGNLNINVSYTSNWREADTITLSAQGSTSGLVIEGSAEMASLRPPLAEDDAWIASSDRISVEGQADIVGRADD